MNLISRLLNRKPAVERLEVQVRRLRDHRPVKYTFAGMVELDLRDSYPEVRSVKTID